MKQLLKLVVIGTLLLLTFCAGSAFADRFADSYVDEPPVEVLLHIQEKYSDYLMEDYITISGTSKGDYGFALMSQNGRRVLLGYHDDGSGMKYWIRNSDAVPQGDGYVYFKRHTNTAYISQGNATATYDNALGFDVIRIDKEHEEYWSQTVSYHWRNGYFQLFAYMDRDDGFERAYVTDGGVSFYDFTKDRKLGRVSGTVQRNLRYVNFSTLPKTQVQAENKLTVAPNIPSGELSAQNIKFSGGKKYEVYSAPSISSLRGGNGKAAVSTNDWIQVFGSEDGFILIQYAIDKDRMRFGYIKESALPNNASVQTMNWRNTAVYLSQYTSLTDDPLNSQSSLLALQQGSKLTLLGTMGNWAYVETTSGTWARGFVPQNVLDYSQVYNLNTYSDGYASGTLTVNADNQVSLNMVVSMVEMPAYFLLTDEKSTHLGYASAVAGKSGSYQMQGYLPSNTTCVRFIPIQSDGTQGSELFSISW